MYRIISKLTNELCATTPTLEIAMELIKESKYKYYILDENKEVVDFRMKKYRRKENEI